MSKKEMENLDEQVMQVANSAGMDRDAYEAEKTEREEASRAKELHAKKIEEMERHAAREVERWKARHLLKMLAKVAACMLAVCVFLVLILNPAFWVPVVGCLGILTFVVVGAISVDRYVRFAKEWR